MRCFMSKKEIVILIACLVMVFAAHPVSRADTGDDAKAGEVLAVKGDVRLVRDDREIGAEPSMQLRLKDEVETGRSSRTKLFFIDDSILNLGELSRVEVEEFLYTPRKKRSRSIYRLISGSLKAVVGRSDLEIHTPTAVAAARGTKFIVWVGGSGDEMYTGVMTLESEVAVRSAVRGIAGEVVVKSGQMSRVYMNRPPEAARPIDLEMMKQFSERTFVLGSTKNGGGLPEGVHEQSAGGVYMFRPPLTQEPIETSVPVTVDVIFP